ncbi:MAG TPA: hypothetical protein VLA13_04725 [Massilibacterium sp.]|nr:hypothetical protein [Massilibacterium sp.]
MDLEQYEKLIEDFTNKRKGVSESKREDYTRGDKTDVLKNFKTVAEATGLDPLQVWMVYAHKHWDAICAYVQNHTESEPIEGRFGDLAVYLELGWGLINDKEGYSIGDSTSIYKKGDKVEIVDNKFNHGFEIGEVVTLNVKFEDYWLAESDVDTWNIREVEFEKVFSESTGRSFGI